MAGMRFEATQRDHASSPGHKSTPASLEASMPDTPTDGVVARDAVMIASECHRCIYRLQDGLACVAFPWGIPEEIRSGQIQHIRPYPGDGGFQFVPLRVK